MGSSTITEPKSGNATQNGHGRVVVCHECGKTFQTEKRSDRGILPYNNTVEGPICRNRPECRGRQLSQTYEERGLKRWSRETQEQLLAVMDAPPPKWDPQKKWLSVQEGHERVFAAVKFFSICWPVCLPYAVQCDADGEPIREFGEWKRHTHRTIAAVLHMNQARVTQAITYLRQRKMLTDTDGRLYPELGPKSLNQLERDSCTRISGLNLNDLRALPLKTQKLLTALQDTMEPDLYTRIIEVARDTCTQINRQISDARTWGAKRVLDSIPAGASLLSRLGKAETILLAPSSSDSTGTPQRLPSSMDDDGESPGKYLPVEVTPAVQTPEAISEMYAAGLGKGALAKLPSPRPLVDTSPVEQIAAGTGLDEDAAGKIWRKTRALDASVTGPEVQQLVVMKLGQLREAIRRGKVENLPGLLIEAVPKMVRGPDLRTARDFLRAAAGEGAGAAELEEQNNIRFAEQILSGAVKDAGPSEIDWAREISDAAKRKGMK